MLQVVEIEDPAILWIDKKYRVGITVICPQPAKLTYLSRADDAKHATKNEGDKRD